MFKYVRKPISIASPRLPRSHMCKQIICSTPSELTHRELVFVLSSTFTKLCFNLSVRVCFHLSCKLTSIFYTIKEKLPISHMRLFRLRWETSLYLSVNIRKSPVHPTIHNSYFYQRVMICIALLIDSELSFLLLL